MHGILPTRRALAIRRVEVSLVCPLCTAHVVEDDAHVLLHCELVEEVWLEFQGILPVRMGNTLQEWFQLVAEGDKSNLALVAFYLAGIWHARNKVVWSNEGWNAAVVLLSINGQIESWKQAAASSSLTLANRSSSPTIWSPPPAGFVKCNVDAALFAEEAKVGYGLVICDEAGRFVAASNGLVVSPQDPFLAEAMALKEALSWLKEHKFEKIHVEVDCQKLWCKVRASGMDHSYFGIVVNEIKLLLNSFNSISIRHVRRTANVLAHALARSIDLEGEIGYWSSAPPACIQNYFILN
ncbi:hypothetical protein OROMI_016824 [Orobanche minor]